MVDAVVSFVVERLGDLLIQQVVSLRGVEDDVVWLKNKLENLKSFLKDAEEKQDDDNRMRQWISDLRDVAHEAEDIIDDFIVLKVEAEREATTQKDWLDLLGSPFKKAKPNQEANLYGIGGKIKTLKEKLCQIQQNQVDFHIRSINDVGEGSDRMNKMDRRRKERPYKDNEHVVGFKEDAVKLMCELVKEVKDRYVISIVGTGGLGKTTIARKLYNTLTPTKKFDCCWVSVSNNYKIQELLRSAIKSFKGQITKDEIELLEKMEEEDLERYLRKWLEGRRYLVVLDDVWDENAWPSLMRAFPDENNGSRVIMTTRIKAVAEPSDGRTYVYELPFLKGEESWELFCSKAFPNYDDEVGNRKNCCPPHLESLAREMISKCRGLPLAIVVLGGLLRRKKEEEEWRRLKEHMWRHVMDHGSNYVHYLLALSFNDLPSHLKSCFLYMGLFPEDFEIVAEELCQLWEAEGFIKLNRESFEEAAEECLRELIDRSLIQVAERNWKRILKYQVHDLLRDFAIKISEELNFLHICGDRTLSPNIRRLASYSNCAFQRFFSLGHSDMRLRTLLFFGSTNMEIAQLQSLCRKLRLLRVLDVGHHSSFFRRRYDGQTEERLLDEIGKLIHLRYLGLSGTKIKALSQFIGNLHALQTLQLSEFQPIQLPDEVCKAKQLRNLIGCFKWPFQVDNLQNLRTLRKVKVDQDRMEFNPMDLINLRELHVNYVGEGNNRLITLDSIGGLRSLQSLEVGVSEQPENLEVHLHPLSHCQNLVQLRLVTSSSWTIWKLPTEVLPNLKYLSVIYGRFDEDPMPMLEKLPKLTVLVMFACDLPELVCSTSAGGFPQLQILQIQECFMKKFQVEEGGMPVLNGLLIKGECDLSIPDRLRTIPAPQPPIKRSEWAY